MHLSTLIFAYVTARGALVRAELGHAPNAPPPPGQVFDLSHWQLQTPVSNGKGGVVVISQPELATFVNDNFYTNATDLGMTLDCPVNGAHTSGSNYPRSELREVPNWTFKGTNIMNVSLQVLRVPELGVTTIGQVHIDGLSGACSIIIEFEWDNGSLIAHLRNSQCRGVKQTVASGLMLGEAFDFTISVDKKTVSVSTSHGDMTPYTYTWMNTSVPIYFKAGNYVQESGSSSTDGATVKITALSVSHA